MLALTFPISVIRHNGLYITALMRMAERLEDASIVRIIECNAYELETKSYQYQHKAGVCGWSINSD